MFKKLIVLKFYIIYQIFFFNINFTAIYNKILYKFFIYYKLNCTAI